MAGIRKKGDAYYCTFRFQGRRYYFTVGDMPEAQALAKGAEVDETLGLIELGRLTVPEGVSLEEFVAAGGKAPVVAVRPETVTTRNTIDRYLAPHANGTIEENSLGTAKTHLNQFLKTVGERFRIQGLTLADLQGHVDRRRQKGVSPVTMKKEISTVRACWNWAVHSSLLKGAFPGRGPRFPKEDRERAVPHVRGDRGHHRRREPGRGAVGSALGIPLPEAAGDRGVPAACAGPRHAALGRPDGGVRRLHGGAPQRDAPGTGHGRGPDWPGRHRAGEEARQGEALDPHGPLTPK